MMDGQGKRGRGESQDRAKKRLMGRMRLRFERTFRKETAKQEGGAIVEGVK